jgi:hypothetical protein
MESERNVILINEEILTEDIMEVSKAVKEVTDTFRTLKSGVREQKFLDSIKKLDKIEYALRKLGEKDFDQFKAIAIFLNN